jgi:coenzyme Q-binding protein COQ10
VASHTETRLLPYSADLMFSIVADVERYPEFLPWCTGLRVLSRVKDGARDVLIAELLVGYRALRDR